MEKFVKIRNLKSGQTTEMTTKAWEIILQHPGLSNDLQLIPDEKTAMNVNSFPQNQATANLREETTPTQEPLLVNEQGGTKSKK